MAELKLPLPGVTRRQAQLLTLALYSFMRDQPGPLPPASVLIELGQVARQFNCTAVLGLVDSVLVAKCAAAVNKPVLAADAAGAWLTVQDAPGQHQLARKLGHVKNGALVGPFLGKACSSCGAEPLGPQLCCHATGRPPHAEVGRGCLIMLRPDLSLSGAA